MSDPRLLEYGLSVPASTPQRPIQVRAREPDQPPRMLPRHRDELIEIVDALYDNSGSMVALGRKLERAHQILTMYGDQPTGYCHVNPLDYLELTAEAA